MEVVVTAAQQVVIAGIFNGGGKFGVVRRSELSGIFAEGGTFTVKEAGAFAASIWIYCCLACTSLCQSVSRAGYLGFVVQN